METIPHPENRLAGEKSPYLLQHARNPVDWYPWGDEAFARARAEQRPIFLSIGYSTCHWCHVMERESFEDDATAALMNRLFVCIKVDREERPDVDAVYMAYVQATTGGGGWPMSVFLTPDLAPFYGGTYFPVENRYGMPGFRSLLARIGHIWDERRDEVVSQSAKAVGQLRKIAQADARSDGDLTRVDFSAVVDRAAASFARAYDEEHGGFGNAPKFPRPSVLDLLARHAARTGSQDSARMVIDTLRQMARGGIHDHLGGGFARYSVDAEWHVPHFEKMLYDQAQLVASHVDAIKLTTDAATRNELEKTLRAMVGYLRRDLLDPVSGAFFSAEDADSMTPSGERKEGAFYVFSQREIDEALGENAALFSAHYGTTEHGNAHDPHGELTGQNVLHAQRSVADTAARFHLGSDETERRLRDCRAVLLALRDTRPRPRLDDKVLTAWNGQMIGALARAGALLGEAAWVEMSTRAATFITDRLWNAATGTLHRRYRDGEVAIPGYLDDHAFFANGLVDLYEAGFDRRWLTLAETICDRMIARFADEQGGGAGNGFWATDGSDPSVLVRVKDDYDGAEPAGNSVAAIVCQRLGHALDRRDLLDRADGTLRACARRLTEMPHALPEMCLAVDTSLTPPVQIILAGERSDPELGLLLAVANLVPLPGRVLLFADAEARAELGKRLPFLASAVPILVDGRMHAAAYVCHAFACDRPVVTPSDLAAVLARDTKIAFV